MAGLWRMSAMELAALIRDRQVSVREVIETHLRRTDAVSPALNGVVVRLDEQALAAADAADRAIAAGDQLPPLHGVPSRSRLAARTSPRSPFGGTAKASMGAHRQPLGRHPDARRVQRRRRRRGRHRHDATRARRGCAGITALARPPVSRAQAAPGEFLRPPGVVGITSPPSLRRAL